MEMANRIAVLESCDYYESRVLVEYTINGGNSRRALRMLFSRVPATYLFEKGPLVFLYPKHPLCYCSAHILFCSHTVLLTYCESCS